MLTVERINGQRSAGIENDSLVNKINKDIKRNKILTPMNGIKYFSSLVTSDKMSITFAPQVANDAKQITASRAKGLLETVNGSQLRQTQWDQTQLNGMMVVQKEAQMNFVLVYSKLNSHSGYL